MKSIIKNLKCICVILTVALFFVSCTKVDESDFTAKAVTNDMALIQLINQLPVPVADKWNFLKVELNGEVVSRGIVGAGSGDYVYPLNSWSLRPSELRYYEVPVGTVSIKLYRNIAEATPADPNPVPVMQLEYDKQVTVQAGKQGLILYDFDKPPVVHPEVDNFLPERTRFYTDTVQYLKFFNFMHESAGVESTLKLQYQYQYVYHPIWTEEDVANGKAPDGVVVGPGYVTANDNTTKRTEWLNLGAPVGFGENTGWQLVPVKRTQYLNQGSASVYYRIVVAQGGTEGVNMTVGEHQLICRNNRAAGALFNYNDYWTANTGRWYYHIFAGYRDDGAPGPWVAQFIYK